MIAQAEKLNDPEALILENFSLQHLKPSDIASYQTRAGSSQGQARNAARLIKADMRSLNN